MKNTPIVFLLLTILLCWYACSFFDPEDQVPYVTFETTFGGGGKYVATDVEELDNYYLVVGAAGAECDLMDAACLFLDKTTGLQVNFNHFGEEGEGNEDNFFDVQRINGNEFAGVGFNVGKESDCSLKKDSAGRTASRLFFTRFDSTLNQLGTNTFIDPVLHNDDARWYAGYSISQEGNNLYIAGATQARNSLLIRDLNGLEISHWTREGVLGEYQDIDVEDESDIVMSGWVYCWSWELEAPPFSCLEADEFTVFTKGATINNRFTITHEKYYAFPGYIKSEGRSITNVGNNGYIIAGRAVDTLEKEYLLLIRIAADGTLLNYKITSEQGIANDITDTDGGYVLTGAMDNDLLVMKVDENLNELWREQYNHRDLLEGTNRGQNGQSIIETQDGGFLCVGSADLSAENNTTIYMVKTDARGKVR